MVSMERLRGFEISWRILCGGAKADQSHKTSFHMVEDCPVNQAGTISMATSQGNKTAIEPTTWHPIGTVAPHQADIN
ncbi:hypothetical protein JF547_09690 [Thalassospira povalilytica]|uniref:Uncharacterized protein n=1 Tax=Thalassospira povalilytica TaxID=732237 RepID=A0A8I1SJC5_9PROT|nr:hypothetical protein [Thalassospira povalilytica]